LLIVDFRLPIENRKSAIGNWQLSYKPSFLRGSDGFFIWFIFALAVGHKPNIFNFFIEGEGDEKFGLPDDCFYG